MRKHFSFFSLLWVATFLVACGMVPRPIPVPIRIPTETELSGEEQGRLIYIGDLTEWAKYDCEHIRGQILDVRERVKHAKIVVEGQLVDLPPHGAPWKASIQVSKYIKGRQGSGLIIVEDLDPSATCGVDLRTGVDFIFYINGDERSQIYRPVQLTGGDAVAIADPLTIQEAINAAGHAPIIVPPAQTATDTPVPTELQSAMTEAWATTFELTQAAATVLPRTPTPTP